MVTFRMQCCVTIQSMTFGSAELQCNILAVGIRWSLLKALNVKIYFFYKIVFLISTG